MKVVNDRGGEKANSIQNWNVRSLDPRVTELHFTL